MAESTRPAGPNWGVSRRDFMKGSGAAATVAALSAEAARAEEQQAQVIKGPVTITLKVNGKEQQVTVEPRTTLLEVLRYQLNLTGAKPVALDGSSGASTVMLAGKPIEAATTLAVACVGKSIQTVESLGGESPDAVPRAFVQHDAEQCGFCTPGFVVAVRAFLDQHPKATEDEIRAGLNGNICRCGTYANIIMAAIAVVRGEVAKGG